MKAMEPDTVMVCNLASFLVVELEHQPSHKHSEPTTCAACYGAEAMMAQNLSKQPSYHQSNLSPMLEEGARDEH